MADPTLSASAVPEDAVSLTSTSSRRPIDLNPPNLRSCFICLLNESETPNAVWVTPCPCTLEAHEDCMLRWVAETENTSGRNRKALRCPACNARIRVDEPFDLVVNLRERIQRVYSRAAPIVLLETVLSGMWVGSASYGYVSARLFAGHAVVDWLIAPRLMMGFNRPIEFGELVRLWAEWTGKATILSLVAPTILLHRALPGLGRAVTLPASLIVRTPLFFPVLYCWLTPRPVW
jgi:hypothetical protein